MVERDVYSWANMLVATPDEVAAIEVRDGRIGVERARQFVTRSNHHSCLGVNPDDDDVSETIIRYQLADAGIRKVACLDDVFALLRTHAPGRDYGICRHGTLETVYSYVVHWREGETAFYAYQGHPCEGGEFVKVPLTFGGENSFSAYPSRYAN